MTPDEFTAASVAIVGTAVGWQSKIARRLGIDSRHVRRWLTAGTVPDWAALRMAGLMGATAHGPWPRDEWVIGDGVTDDGRAREYITHLAPPRFSARIVETGRDGLPVPHEMPADVQSGTVYANGDTVLCEIAWIDDPAPGEITHLLEAACDAIDRQDQRDTYDEDHPYDD